MASELSNSMNVLNSRDVIDRLTELKNERDALVIALGEAQDELDTCDQNVEAIETASEARADAEAELTDWDNDYADELRILTELNDEGERLADWTHGEMLIRDDHFEDYARELAEDIGAVNRDMSWPCNCIDWEKAASELQVDYTSLDFDGVTYWVRG
jgi:hypothetical protein